MARCLSDIVSRCQSRFLLLFFGSMYNSNTSNTVVVVVLAVVVATVVTDVVAVVVTVVVAVAVVVAVVVIVMKSRHAPDSEFGSVWCCQSVFVFCLFHQLLDEDLLLKRPRLPSRLFLRGLLQLGSVKD